MRESRPGHASGLIRDGRDGVGVQRQLIPPEQRQGGDKLLCIEYTVRQTRRCTNSPAVSKVGKNRIYLSNYIHAVLRS
jgi:hypothetical protein